MAKLYAAGDGSILGYSPTMVEQQSSLPSMSSGAVTVLDFDEDANPGIVSDLKAGSGIYNLLTVNGAPVLKKNGVVVAIATSASTLYAFRSAIANGFTDAQFKSAIVALWNGTASSAQQQKSIAYCLYKLRQANLI